VPDLLLRGFTQQELDWMGAYAEAQGIDRHTWAKRVLLREVKEPVVRTRYGLYIRNRNGVPFEIIRSGDRPEDTAIWDGVDAGQEDQQLIGQAAQLIRRNHMGDREQAMDLLKKAGYEVSVIA